MSLDKTGVNVSKDKEFGTVVINCQAPGFSKKRKMANPPSPDGVPISNSFSELPISDNAQGNDQPKEKKPSKPPPIILYGLEDVNKLTEFLETTAERPTFNYKLINKNQESLQRMSISSKI